MGKCRSVWSQPSLPWHFVPVIPQESGWHRAPASPLSLRWALETIAKLGGWRNIKRTGRIGWMTLWKGCARFQERLVGRLPNSIHDSMFEEAEM